MSPLKDTLVERVHAASNSDRGGTCQPVQVTPPEQNLHYAWDDAVVVELENELGTHRPVSTATALERLYPQNSSTAATVSAEQMARETHELAKAEVYEQPEKPCAPSACEAAPGGPVVISTEYMKREATVPGRQLAKAGYRLVPFE